VFFGAAHPDDAVVATIAHRIDNQRDAAGQFAADFVAAVLTTPATKHAALKRFITVPESETQPLAAASTPPPAAVINTPKVWSVVPEGSAGDVDLYSATVVVVQQRPYAPAEPSPGVLPGAGIDLAVSAVGDGLARCRSVTPARAPTSRSATTTHWLRPVPVRGGKRVHYHLSDRHHRPGSLCRC
jgi:hypothetical protein